LFSLTSAAAVTCGIMKPEFSPAPGARKKAAGPSLRGGIDPCARGDARLIPAQRAQRNAQKIKREGDRFPVEVAAGG